MTIGRKTGGGSRKGIPNKTTAELREMIEGALADAGGRAYLAAQASENPAAFMALIGKLIPRDLNVSGEVRHTLEQLITSSIQQKPQERVLQ